MSAGPERRSAAFVIPHPYVDALACFREPIRYLASAGWAVDLYTRLSPVHPAPFFGIELVRLIPLETTRAGALRLLRQLTVRRPGYDVIVTVPQWGLHYASIAARIANIPLGCISDELTSDAEATTPESRRWRTRERRAHRACRWTIALSEPRAAFVRKENQLSADHPIFIVPNAEAGTARRLSSRYFHDTLNLGSDQRVLLHAGSLWWSGLERLAAVTDTWTDGWVLVLQGRFAHRNGWRDLPHARLAPEVLPAALLDYAVSSASIGVALYDETTANNTVMGTASGKVSLYLKNSLPVIVTRAGGFDWVEREGCGVCVTDAREVHAAANRIAESYGAFAANAARFYDEHLDFTPRFRPVFDAIERDAARRS